MATAPFSRPTLTIGALSQCLRYDYLNKLSAEQSTERLRFAFKNFKLPDAAAEEWFERFRSGDLSLQEVPEWHAPLTRIPISDFTLFHSARYDFLAGLQREACATRVYNSYSITSFPLDTVDRLYRRFEAGIFGIEGIIPPISCAETLYDVAFHQ